MSGLSFDFNVRDVDPRWMPRGLLPHLGGHPDGSLASWSNGGSRPGTKSDLHHDAGVIRHP